MHRSAAASIELRHLRYFLAVADHLHFRRAANQLGIAQPAVSTAIRRLEEALGVTLLQRTTRRVRLTEAGQVFAAESRQLLDALDGAVAETQHVAGV